MPDAAQRQPSGQESSEPIQYASFILRCWTSGSGQIRARLIDAQSGISHPVADLADLPEQVRSLMARITPSASPESTENHSSAG
jgi:hypothetical protein